MTLIELVRKYQRYDPATGNFDRNRTQREYAADLGVHEVVLSRFLSNKRPGGALVLRAFLRRYPQAASDVSMAVTEDARQPVAIA